MNELKWGGFVYLLTIVVHFNCEEPSAILLTPNKLEYTFFPFTLKNSTVLKFKVRAPHNAHLMLSGEPEDGNPSYEIVLGGWGNTKSSLRFNHTRPDKSVVSTKGILNAGELRGFWVNCSQGFVGIGREGELIPFLKWTNPRPFKVQYFGVRTSWGATGEWIIDDSNVPYARIDLYNFRIGYPAIVNVDVLSKTTPFLIWKVHNHTYSEGDFYSTGRFHPTKALLKKEGEWQAKLIITAVSFEDTQEEILLTARNRSKLGAKSYHVFIYALNATTNYTDDLVGNEATESSSIDSLSLTDAPIICYTVSTLESNKSNTKSNNITGSILKEERTSTTAMRTQKIMGKTLPIQLATTSSLRSTSHSIESTRTTPNTIRTVTISNNNQSKTTAMSRNATKAINVPTNENIIPKSNPNKTAQHILYNLTYPNKMYTTSTKPISFINLTKQHTITQNFSKNITRSMPVTRMLTSTTAGTDLLSQKLQSSDHVRGAEHVTVGVLLMVLLLMAALLAYIMIKHKNMTGQWGFTAKCQTPISMANLYDDDNSCLIQQP